MQSLLSQSDAMFPPVAYSVGAQYQTAREVAERFDLHLMRLEILYGDEQ
jgi:hypothetical protein